MGQDDVAGLNIAVNDVVHMEVAECVDQLAEDVTDERLG